MITNTKRENLNNYRNKTYLVNKNKEEDKKIENNKYNNDYRRKTLNNDFNDTNKNTKNEENKKKENIKDSKENNIINDDNNIKSKIDPSFFKSSIRSKYKRRKKD